MNIIFVVSAINGGGAERVIVTLANYYVGQGDDVTILMVAGDTILYRLDERIKIFSIGQPSGGKLLIQIRRLLSMRKYFKTHKDSYIISFSTRINMFSILSSFGIKVPLIVSERNDPNRFHHAWLRNKIYEFGAKENTYFVFQTEDAKRCFSKRIQRKSMVIPNPIRNDLPQAYNGIREKKIAAVGRLEAQKNHNLLLEAFRGFHQKFPEYELHIFGEGKLEKTLRKKSFELQINNCVFFEGFKKDVLEIIRKYSMFVLSSDYEGISNSLIEAMALGIPCISTDCPIGGSRLSIDSRKNGLLVPPGNPLALQKAMEELAENREFSEKLGMTAINVREIYSEEKIADRWRRFLKR